MPKKDIHKIINAIRHHTKYLSVPYVEKISKKSRAPFRVLISCMLRTRTKDDVTAAASTRLFSLAKTPRDMALLDESIIEKAIYPVGFYRMKSKHIKDVCSTLEKDYGGIVPDSIEKLLCLKGVGRKTANLVVSRGFLTALYNIFKSVEIYLYE